MYILSTLMYLLSITILNKILYLCIYLGHIADNWLRICFGKAPQTVKDAGPKLQKLGLLN